MAILLSEINEKKNSPIVKVAISIALLIFCSKIKIPLFYVPVTLQTFAIYLIAMRSCPKEAFASVMGYLAIGCFGIPVWAHSGASLFTGVTTGYLIGMVLAAPLISYMVRKSIGNVISCIAGILLIDFLGVLWLLNFMDAGKAIACGFLPFILPDVFKIGMATGFCSFLNRKNTIF